MFFFPAECWTHEESKGWIRVAVGCEKGPVVDTAEKERTDKDLIDLKVSCCCFCCCWCLCCYCYCYCFVY